MEATNPPSAMGPPSVTAKAGNAGGPASAQPLPLGVRRSAKQAFEGQSMSCISFSPRWARKGAFLTPFPYVLCAAVMHPTTELLGRMGDQ